MMKNAKKLIWFLFLNALVSAATVIVVMNLWTKANPCYAEEGVGFEQLKESILGDQIPVDEEPMINPPGSSGEELAGLFSITSVVGAGDLESEYIVIRYLGAEPVSMQGWRLINQDGLEFVFPNVRLLNNTDMRVNSREGANSVSGLYWGADAAVWESGKAVELRDPEGILQAEYLIP